MSETENSCANCDKHRNLGVDIRRNASLDVPCDSESLQSKCQSWLEKCTISSESVVSSGSSENTNNCGDSSELQAFRDTVATTQSDAHTIIHEAFNQVHTYGQIHVNKSQDVHLGNITNIYGPVYITHAFSMVNHQSVTNQLLVDLPAPVKHGELNIISRKNWRALAPVQERILLNGPAKFVIISHTVSEPYDSTQYANTKLVNSVQRFHMSKRNFDDIGYNFLIGSDGIVYEGRGWSVVGAHTCKYNKFSVGIAFMGYFCEKLPSHGALKQAKVLIERGVELGAIDENYKLLGHCQCIETDSPGDILYLEIQKWDNWERKIDVQHPPPLEA